MANLTIYLTAGALAGYFAASCFLEGTAGALADTLSGILVGTLVGALVRTAVLFAKKQSNIQ